MDQNGEAIQEWEFSPMTVTVPDGVAAGMPISIETPHGHDLEVLCPRNIAVGDTFQCLYYTSADEQVNAVGTDWQTRSNPSSVTSGGRVQFQLCNSCGHGQAAKECIKCGTRATVGQCPAPACRDCVLGSKSKRCVKCDAYFGDGPRHPAILCRTCGFGPDGANLCAKCGEHCGAFRG